MAASSTELALRQVAFLLPPFHLRYLFSRIMSKFLLFVYAQGFAAISVIVSKIASLLRRRSLACHAFLPTNDVRGEERVTSLRTSAS